MDNKRRAFSDIRQEDAAEIWRYPLTDNARNAILDVWQKVYKIKRPEPPKKVKPIRPDYFFSYGSFQVLFLLVVVYFHPTFKGSVGMTIMIVTIWTLFCTA